MQAEFVYQNDDFITEYDTISSATRTQIKDLAIKLSVKPSPDLFWILSRYITFATINDLSALTNTIIELLKEHCNTFLGACFAAAHFINRMSTEKKEECQNLCSSLQIPTCPIHARQIINLLTVDGMNFSNFTTIIGNPDICVQKAVASAIAQTCDNPEILLEKYLSDIENETNFNRRRGLIILCNELSYVEMPAEIYIQKIVPLINTQGKSVAELSSIYEAQNFLARLITSNPSTFHGIDFVTGIKLQYESNNLSPDFLSSYIRAFGRSAIKSLSNEILPEILKKLPKTGKQLIKIFAPYVQHFNSEKKNLFFSTMVDLCIHNRFDVELFDITAQAFAALSPVIPSQIGLFLNAIEKSPISQRFYSILGPVLQPRSPAPPQKLSTVTVVLPEDKHEIEVQCVPLRSDGGCQTEEAI